jgi:hypothetical protein
VNFISDFLFEIPEPLSLNTSQITLIRNDFSKTSWKLFVEIASLNEELKNISFTKDNFEKIASVYNEKIALFKPALQKTVDENPCFQELKNDTKNRKVYKIHTGISSFNTILGFYEKLGIIDANNVVYIREDMASRVDINNSRLFLFLETSDN